MRILLTLAFGLLGLATSLLAFEVIGSPTPAMITGTSIYIALELLTEAARI